MTPDSELLHRYAETRSEDAFAELVRRHLDLVYSTALRGVNGDAHLAQDVAQTVFTDLARKAASLTHRPVLTGWLYTSAHFAGAKIVRGENRRRDREEKFMREPIHETAPDPGCAGGFAEARPGWEQVRPLLDEVMHELKEADREAVLLRYFENRPFAEIGERLGLNENTARMRVERALEKLRGCLARRGVTTAAALASVISANAVQAAPVGLTATISAAAALAGTTVSTSTVIAATKTIAMTTLQKTLVTATVAVLAGAGIYEARQASRLRDQVNTFEQQQAPLAEQIQQLQRERDEATNRLAVIREEIAQLKSGQKSAELLKLRGEVGMLRQQAAKTKAEADSPASGIAKMMSDPAMKEYIQVAMQDLIKRRYGPLFQELKLTPEQVDKVIQLMSAHFTEGAERLGARQQGGAGPVAPAQTDAESNAEFGRQMASLLGESGLARFQEFSLEVPARMTVDHLNVQLGGSKLSDEQGARLFQVVKAEPFELTHGIAGDPDDAFFGSQADIDNFLRKVAESNQRVLQQAGDFLNPEQLAALNTVLTNGINARIAQGAAFSPKR